LATASGSMASPRLASPRLSRVWSSGCGRLGLGGVWSKWGEGFAKGNNNEFAAADLDGMGVGGVGVWRGKDATPSGLGPPMEEYRVGHLGWDGFFLPETFFRI
jgi:hypothetical protein